MKSIKVLVTGASGNISYSLLFRLASGEVFGKNIKIHLHLLELENRLNILHGIAMELEDCAFSTLGNIIITSNIKDAMDGINWAILIGSFPRKNNMERSDLLELNAPIFINQGKHLNKYAANDIKVLVVGNPCNTNCLITINHANDIPKDRFFAMTLLDENRAKYQLSKKTGINIKNIKNMIIWGNHSSTQYPDYFNAKILNKNINEYIKDKSWFSEKFIPIIQKRGMMIIKKRGLSSSASAANAIVQNIQLLNAHNTETFSLCIASNGEYSIDPGIVFSYPCYIKNNILKIKKNIIHNELSKRFISQSLKELVNEKNILKNKNII